MFDYCFHPSSLTPGPPLFAQEVERALSGVGASRASLDDVRLRDGSRISVHTDGALAVITVPRINEAIVEALFTVADQTRSFLLLNGDQTVAWRTPGNLGEEPAEALTFWPIWDIESVEHLQAMLAEGIKNDQPDEPPERLPAADQRPSRSLLERLSDKLFGRAI